MARHRVLLVLVLCAPPLRAAESPSPDDSVPPGARGAVLAVRGEVRTIVGLSSAVGGRVDPLSAALAELGARTTETEIRIDLSADVLFDFDRADIKASAEPALEKVATVLESYPGAAVTVEGHTDAKGSAEYNQRLSERRAAAVAHWLRARARLAPAGLTTRGWGAARPVAPNVKPDGSDDPAGRQKNRRVEVVVKKPGRQG